MQVALLLGSYDPTNSILLHASVMERDVMKSLLYALIGVSQHRPQGFWYKILSPAVENCIVIKKVSQLTMTYSNDHSARFFHH